MKKNTNNKQQKKRTLTPSPSTNPNRKRMYVDVHAPFEDIHRRNQEALKRLAKRGDLRL